MSGSLKGALLILVVGVNIFASTADPCSHDGGGHGGGPGPTKPTRCRELNGFCYNALCKNCTDGHIRTDLCGDDENENRKCCLPGPPPPYVCCEIFSDPHIITYDGLRNDVQIPGTFDISMPCNTADFKVQARFVYPQSGAIWTKVDRVIVHVDGFEIFIEPTEVTVDGIVKTLPQQLSSSGIEIYAEGFNVYVYIPNFNVLICFNVVSMRLTVYVDTRYQGQLCGLCGNYNLDSRDDGKDTPELPEATKRCPRPRTHDDWQYCRVELKKILADCPNISIHRYLEACAFDMCAEGREVAGLTLNSATEHCNSNVDDKMLAQI